MDGLVGGWTERGMYGQMDEWMDGWELMVEGQEELSQIPYLEAVCRFWRSGRGSQWTAPCHYGTSPLWLCYWLLYI